MADGGLGPTFIDLDTARDAAIRELDAFATLAASLQDDDWSRPTPCPEWTVRDLVEHVAGVPGYDYFAGRLRGARLGDKSGPSTNASTSQTGLEPSALIGVLRLAAGEFATELAFLGPDDLDRQLYVMPGRRQLLRSALGAYVWEFGIHHYDLATALGRSVELSEDVCRATVLFAETDGYRQDREGAAPRAADPAPDEDVSYSLIGDSVRWDFSFTAGLEPHPFSPTRNGRWEPGVLHERVCAVRGTDSAVCLVLAGRASTHDDRVAATAGFPPRTFTVW